MYLSSKDVHLVYSTHGKNSFIEVVCFFCGVYEL